MAVALNVDELRPVLQMCQYEAIIITGRYQTHKWTNDQICWTCFTLSTHVFCVTLHGENLYNLLLVSHAVDLTTVAL